MKMCDLVILCEVKFGSEVEAVHLTLTNLSFAL